jgi:hypothetical protein
VLVLHVLRAHVYAVSKADEGTLPAHGGFGSIVGGVLPFQSVGSVGGVPICVDGL